MIRFILNREDMAVGLPAGMVLLDFLRRHRGLAGTKEGCREGDCGACLVLLGEPREEGVFYRPVNSCLLPLGEAAGRHVVTIEGLNREALTPVQQAIVEEGATQCGFCTPGFVVSLADFLLSSPVWDEPAGVDAMGGNICRCTGYVSIRRALRRVCAALNGLGAPPPPHSPARVRWLVDQGWLPAYLPGVSERLRALSSGADPSPSEAVPVAGGTDLFVQRAEQLETAELEFLSCHKELRGVRVEDGQCLIGAATAWADLEDSPLFRKLLPGIAEWFKLCASRPIRHRATVGGNIVNASPIGDLTILLLALDARLALSDGRSRRDMRLRDFYSGYKQLNKRVEEIVVEVAFSVPPSDAVLSFEKVCRRTHLDIASVNSAMLATVRNETVESIHLSAGGVAPVPLNLGRTAERLQGTPLIAAAARAALETAQTEIAPISDVRGSADYKRQLLRQLLIAHFLRIAPALEEEFFP